MSTDAEVREEPQKITVPGGNFTEQGLQKYSESIAATLNDMFIKYAYDTALSLKLITSKSSFTGNLGGVRSTNLQNTCKTLMTAFVRKLRKEMPFMGPNVLGIHEGHSAGEKARAFMLLDARPSTVRYITLLQKMLEKEPTPYLLNFQIFKVGLIGNRAFKEACTSAGLTDDTQVMGAVLDLGNTKSYFETIYNPIAITPKIVVGGKEYHTSTDVPRDRTARQKWAEKDCLPAPHMVHLMPHICQAMSTLSRRLLCFHNVDL